jgi:hypothetical protein
VLNLLLKIARLLKQKLKLPSILPLLKKMLLKLPSERLNRSIMLLKIHNILLKLTSIPLKML